MYELLHQTQSATTEFHDDVDHCKKCKTTEWASLHLMHSGIHNPYGSSFHGNQYHHVCVCECQSMNYITDYKTANTWCVDDNKNGFR